MYEGYCSLSMDVLDMAREQESETSASHRIRVMHDEKSASFVNDSNPGDSPRELYLQSAFIGWVSSSESLSDITLPLWCGNEHESFAWSFGPTVLHTRKALFHHHYVTWHDEPPTCSPFLVPTLIILGLFNCFNIVSKKDIGVRPRVLSLPCPLWLLYFRFVWRFRTTTRLFHCIQFAPGVKDTSHKMDLLHGLHARFFPPTYKGQTQLYGGAFFYWRWH